MYEIEDYEDNISKHRKILWGLSLLLFLGYLFCAGYAYTGAITADCERFIFRTRITLYATSSVLSFGRHPSELALLSARR